MVTEEMAVGRAAVMEVGAVVGAAIKVAAEAAKARAAEAAQVVVGSEVEVEVVG